MLFRHVWYKHMRIIIITYWVRNPKCPTSSYNLTDFELFGTRIVLPFLHSKIPEQWHSMHLIFDYFLFKIKYLNKFFIWLHFWKLKKKLPTFKWSRKLAKRTRIEMANRSVKTDKISWMPSLTMAPDYQFLPKWREKMG